jgi:hypothetical protein
MRRIRDLEKRPGLADQDGNREGTEQRIKPIAELADQCIRKQDRRKLEQQQQDTHADELLSRERVGERVRKPGDRAVVIEKVEVEPLAVRDSLNVVHHHRAFGRVGRHAQILTEIHEQDCE